MKFAIVVFPGSNCDADCHHVVKDLLGCEAEYVWHHDRDLKGADAVILPGGFAYGDYLRAGALARFSPVMESVAEFAKYLNDDIVKWAHIVKVSGAKPEQ